MASPTATLASPRAEDFVVVLRPIRAESGRTIDGVETVYTIRLPLVTG